MPDIASTMRSRSDGTAAPAGEVLDRGAQAVDGRVIQRAGFDAVRRLRILDAQAVRGKPIERAGPRIQHSDMRAIEFVARAQQEIHAERLDVEREMRRVMHRIDHQQRANFAGQPARKPDVVDGAERVR